MMIKILYFLYGRKPQEDFIIKGECGLYISL